MANGFKGRGGVWAFYAIPREAQTIFRVRVMEARSGEPDAVPHFEAAGVTDLRQPVVELYDAVVAGLAAFPEEERPAIETPLFGQALSARPSGAAALIGEVLARGRRDGLDDLQIAGAVAVVLESQGLLPRAA